MPNAAPARPAGQNNSAEIDERIAQLELRAKDFEQLREPFRLMVQQLEQTTAVMLQQRGATADDLFRAFKRKISVPSASHASSRPSAQKQGKPLHEADRAFQVQNLSWIAHQLQAIHSDYLAADWPQGGNSATQSREVRLERLHRQALKVERMGVVADRLEVLQNRLHGHARQEPSLQQSHDLALIARDVGATLNNLPETLGKQPQATSTEPTSADKQAQPRSTPAPAAQLAPVKNDLFDETHTPAQRLDWLSKHSGKIDLNAPMDSSGNRPLHKALMAGDERVVAHLLAQPGIDADARNDMLITPLMVAAARNREHSARLLLDAQANPFAASKSGMLPCIHAQQAGSTRIEQMILEAQARGPAAFKSPQNSACPAPGQQLLGTFGLDKQRPAAGVQAKKM